MTVRSFFDTNVLVYADDRAAPAKQRRALELVAEHRRAGTGVVSLQVLQEYFVTVTRKLGVDAAVARRKVELLAELDVAAPDIADVLAAIDLHRLHGVSFWDALVLRAAKQSGCSILLTEDMQDERVVDGLRIVNPFRSPPPKVHEKVASYEPPPAPARRKGAGGKGTPRRRRAR
jgi:predicted nucleic acid-binding protein